MSTRQLSGRGVFLWGIIMGTIFEQDGQTRFMSISDFDSHRVDNLFLLVGENPLPNYVAARLLLKKGGTPYLVYTTDTEKQADRLQTRLSNESMGLNSAQRVPLNDYEADAYHIKKAVCDRLETIENGTIGLNYTGGTKAMAVHAYRAVFSKDDPEIVFSYLDPRRLEMCIDREHQERVSIKVQPETLPVQLQDIFQIHGLELTNEPAREAKLPELALVLAGIFQDKRKESQWFDWYHNIFCTEARNKKKDESWGNWKSDSKLKLLSIYLENLPLEVIEYFKQQEWVTPNDKLSLQTVQQKEGFSKVEYFCKYLDGLWLEHYVLQQVESIAAKHFINDYGINFEVSLSDTSDGFEFDVAFTRGYQLFALSVSTTSKRSLCKGKLFEAYLRARQMGGDEARVALVCCSDEPGSLKAEMAVLDSKKIAVFGREDLMSLSTKIENWIQENDRNAR
ncbi:MAG: hypothetical protein WBF52_01605 [Geitlerinemataceae cyanobacterium]